MDPLTHSVLGMAVAIAATPAKASRRAAALAGLTGGLLPDADIFLRSATDPLFAVEYHRHFTHSLSFSPVIGFLGALIASRLLRLFHRVVSWRTLFLPALLAGLSHLFCDVWTSYGTRLWWPFLPDRVSLDWISVIDPVFTVPLVACMALAVRYANRRAAWVGLGWASVYLAFCLVQRQRAASAMDQWVADSGGAPVTRRELKPAFGNVLVWRAMIQTGSEMRTAAVHCPLTSSSRVLPGKSHAVFLTPQAAAAAFSLPADSVQARDIERFFHFSDEWVGLHPTDSTVLADLRYAQMPNEIDPLWGIALNPAYPNRHAQWRTWRGDPTPSLRRLFRIIQGKPDLPPPPPPPPTTAVLPEPSPQFSPLKATALRENSIAALPDSFLRFLLSFPAKLSGPTHGSFHPPQYTRR